MDLSAEIERLEDRLAKLQDDIYKNLKPWDRVQIARLADRPTTLDYIEHLFTDFLNVTETERTGTMKPLSAGLRSSTASCNGNRASARQRHEGKPSPQFWDAASRRLQKSASSDETG